ncbi:MAG: hypothetical protein Q7R62_02595 [bacterium]|nr:hypothetical protein [bacterium]
MRISSVSISLLLFLLILSLLPVVGSLAHAASTDPKDSSFQILPDCNPSIFPNGGNQAGSPDGFDQTQPCDFDAFQQLVVNVIKWLLYIMVPIGFCIIGWAGFRILTSAGNSERIHEAYGMIKIVVIGILIAVLSYIIIVNVFNVLNVKINPRTLS